MQNMQNQSVRETLEKLVRALGQARSANDEQFRLLLLGKPDSTTGDVEDTAHIYWLLHHTADLCRQVGLRLQQMESLDIVAQVTIERIWPPLENQEDQGIPPIAPTTPK